MFDWTAHAIRTTTDQTLSKVTKRAAESLDCWICIDLGPHAQWCSPRLDIWGGKKLCYFAICTPELRSWNWSTRWSQFALFSPHRSQILINYPFTLCRALTLKARGTQSDMVLLSIQGTKLKISCKEAASTPFSWLLPGLTLHHIPSAARQNPALSFLQGHSLQLELSRVDSSSCSGLPFVFFCVCVFLPLL